MSSPIPQYEAYVTKWLTENIEKFPFLKKKEMSESDAILKVR